MDSTRPSARGARTSAVWCAVAAALAATTATAATVSLDVGAERSDNIARTAIDEQTETTATARAAIAYTAERPRLTGDLDADLRYHKYLDSSFDDEVVGGANADFRIKVVAERFDWIVQDNFGQISQNRLEVETPDNRQNFNVFSTGPIITLPLGQRTDLELSGLYTDASYEDAEQSSESINGGLALIRQLTESTALSLNGTTSETEYDDPLFETFEIRSAFLQFEGTGARTTLSMDGGYQEVEHGGVTNGGVLAHLNLTRQIGGYSRLTLTAGSDFQDTASQFRLDQTQLGVQPNNQDAVVAADVFRSNFAYLSFTTERERTSFTIALNGIKERHEVETALDRDILRATLGVGRRATERLDLELHGAYSDEDFVELGAGTVAFREWSVGVGVSMRLTPQVSLRLSADHYDGSSDDGSRDYEENRAYVGLGYTTGQR